MSNRKASPRKLAELVLRHKERVRRAHAVLGAKVLRSVEQSLRYSCTGRAFYIMTHEEFGARSRGEGHGGDQLRVVRESVLLVRPRPFPVEYVLPVGIGLQIQTERTEDAARFLTDEVGGRPSAPPPDTARALERSQELEVEEREPGRLERAPRLPVHILDAAEPLDPHHAPPNPNNLKPPLVVF